MFPRRKGCAFQLNKAFEIMFVLDENNARDMPTKPISA
jgi:hypothetical protein